MRDYAVSQRAGITGFPTLIIGPQADGTFAMVSQGFTPGPGGRAHRNWLAAQAHLREPIVPAPRGAGR